MNSSNIASSHRKCKAAAAGAMTSSSVSQTQLSGQGINRTMERPSLRTASEHFRGLGAYRCYLNWVGDHACHPVRIATQLPFGLA